VYGNKVELPNTGIALETFKFAVQWQIKNLDNLAAAESLSLPRSAENLVDLYEAFKLHEKEQHLKEVVKVHIIPFLFQHTKSYYKKKIIFM